MHAFCFMILFKNKFRDFIYKEKIGEDWSKIKRFHSEFKFREKFRDQHRLMLNLATMSLNFVYIHSL